jgi:glycosyltransferase involved in cell wall biosynthesis
MRNVLVSAVGLIGNSQATLDDLAAFAEIQGLPMPPSIAAWISGNQVSDPVQPRTLDGPHFITIGTIEGRKNHQLLLDVWRRLVADLGESAPGLLIVGQRGWQADRVFEQLDNLGGLQGHIRELRTCDDEELAGWIAGAQALLMPSSAEGFGLPVIEALQLGTPVIASNLPVFREIAGNIPNYADAHDAKAWERLVREFTGDSPERSRQLALMQNYHAPDWKQHFAAVERWLPSL